MSIPTITGMPAAITGMAMNTERQGRDYEELDELERRGLKAGFKRAIELGFGKSFWGFAALALVSGIACYVVLGPEAFAEAMRDDLGRLGSTVPRIAVALGIAGLIWVMLPRERITSLVGTESGFRGLLIAIAAGMVTPGGPSAAFPLLSVLAASGADRGAMVAYITSWSLLGMQRILVWDVPFMGAEFSVIRFSISLPLIIIAGLRCPQAAGRAAARRRTVGPGDVVLIGVLVLFAVYIVLAGIALTRRDDTFRRAVRRSVEQFWVLAPRMICALIAAGFIAKLIPSEVIARFLGNDAGFTALLVAFGTGMIIPAGPVIAFSIAAVFLHAGASTAALVTFVTSWSIFATHRIFIYEIPLLGLSFLRLRLLAAGIIPLLAGIVCLAAAWMLTAAAWSIALEESAMRVALVGVGAMGRDMARHLANGRKRTDRHRCEPGGASPRRRRTGATSPTRWKRRPRAAEVFVVVVATDDQSRTVTEGILKTGKPGSVIVIAATNNPNTMRDLAEKASAAGFGFVDAPVVFGRQGAADGTLVSLCGGTEADVERVRPVLMAYSRAVYHVGPVGAGQLAKTCNNMMHWVACVANFEMLLLAKRYGVNAQRMREILLDCPARNGTLADWDTTRFTWHEKDMDVALDLAQAGDLALPLFGQVDQLVKRLGPDQVKELLYGKEAEYLGRRVVPLDRRERRLW